MADVDEFIDEKVPIIKDDEESATTSKTTTTTTIKRKSSCLVKLSMTLCFIVLMGVLLVGGYLFLVPIFLQANNSNNATLYLDNNNSLTIAKQQKQQEILNLDTSVEDLTIVEAKTNSEETMNNEETVNNEETLINSNEEGNENEDSSDNNDNDNNDSDNSDNNDSANSDNNKFEFSQHYNYNVDNTEDNSEHDDEDNNNNNNEDLYYNEEEIYYNNYSNFSNYSNYYSNYTNYTNYTSYYDYDNNTNNNDNDNTLDNNENNNGNYDGSDNKYYDISHFYNDNDNNKYNGANSNYYNDNHQYDNTKHEPYNDNSQGNYYDQRNNNNYYNQNNKYNSHNNYNRDNFNSYQQQQPEHHHDNHNHDMINNYLDEMFQKRAEQKQKLKAQKYGHDIATTPMDEYSNQKHNMMMPSPPSSSSSTLDLQQKQYHSISHKDYQLPLRDSLQFDDVVRDMDYKSLLAKWSPQELSVGIDHPSRPHQFLHLHHMKTAGTSMDSYFGCARKRFQAITGETIPYYNIHECNPGMYEKCLNGDGMQQEESFSSSSMMNHHNCQAQARTSSMMSFCAPLKDLPVFGWTNDNEQQQNYPKIQALTVLRHPVDRVWSMYRFKTKHCYQCRNLTAVYDEIDQVYGQDHNRATMLEAKEEGTTDDMDSAALDLCRAQILNHQTRNLLSKTADGLTEEEILEDAISNMKSFFTVIGLTEQIDATVDIVSQVFPWMATNLEMDPNTRTVFGVDYYQAMDRLAADASRHQHHHHDFDFEGFEEGDDGNSNPMECKFPHRNASPKNNRCGPNGDHWDLPQHPDEKTRQAIIDHNQLDMKLYEAAVEYFELQKQVLGIL